MKLRVVHLMIHLKKFERDLQELQNFRENLKNNRSYTPALLQSLDAQREAILDAKERIFAQKIDMGQFSDLSEEQAYLSAEIQSSSTLPSSPPSGNSIGQSSTKASLSSKARNLDTQVNSEKSEALTTKIREHLKKKQNEKAKEAESQRPSVRKTSKQNIDSIKHRQGLSKLKENEKPSLDLQKKPRSTSEPVQGLMKAKPRSTKRYVDVKTPSADFPFTFD